MERLQQLEQLVAEHPAEPFARYGLALEYANLGQTEAALQQFAKLLEQHPDYIPGYQMSAQTPDESRPQPRSTADPAGRYCSRATDGECSRAKRNAGHAGRAGLMTAD